MSLKVEGETITIIAEELFGKTTFLISEVEEQGIQASLSEKEIREFRNGIESLIEGEDIVEKSELEAVYEGETFDTYLRIDGTGFGVELHDTHLKSVDHIEKNDLLRNSLAEISGSVYELEQLAELMTEILSKTQSHGEGK